MNKGMLNDPLLLTNPDKINLSLFDVKNGWWNWVKYIFQIEKNDLLILLDRVFEVNFLL